MAALNLAIWSMFVLELNHLDGKLYYKVHSIYSLLISALFAILFLTSYNNELFFTSYEIYKFGEIKLILYNKSLLYTIYGIYAVLLYLACGIFMLIKMRTIDIKAKKVFLVTGILSIICAVAICVGYFFYNISVFFTTPIFIAYALYFNRYIRTFAFKGTTISNTFNNLNDPIILFDNNDRIINCSNKALEAFPELKTKNLPISSDFIITVSLKEMLNGTIKTLRHIIPSTSMRKTYNIVYEEINSKSVNYSGQSLLFYDDISYRNLQEKYISISKFDFQTGVFNKAHFNTMGKKLYNTSLNNNLNFSLLIFEIDNFNDISDKYGYKLGDKLLKDTVALAQRIFTPTTSSEVYIFNLQIYQFAIINMNVSTTNIYDIFETFKETIANTPIVSATNIMSYTVSGGIEVIQTTDAITFEDFLVNAREKLAKSKLDGGNRITTFIDEN
ncbi:MAG: GGDEF domain-containing protein [Lachnospirales bacterium]